MPEAQPNSFRQVLGPTMDPKLYEHTFKTVIQLLITFWTRVGTILGDFGGCWDKFGAVFVHPQNDSEMAQDSPKLAQQNQNSPRPSGKSCVSGLASLPIAGVRFGAQSFWFFCSKCVRPPVGLIISGIQSGTKSAQEGPRRAQECHQELQSTGNLHVQKPSKTNDLMCLGPSLSNTAYQAPRSSQEAPEELRNLSKCTWNLRCVLVYFRIIVGIMWYQKKSHRVN